MLGTHYGWLTTCPPNDSNFKSHLADASLDDLCRARGYLATRPKTKTVLAVIDREIRKRHKEAKLVKESINRAMLPKAKNATRAEATDTDG